MTDFFQWLSGGSTTAIVFIATIAFAITIVICIYLVAFLQGREISLWPPRIGERPTDKNLYRAPEIYPAQRLGECGLVHAFRIPVDNAARLRRVRELIEQEAKGNRKFRLAASSGFSYLNPNGPVWSDAGLGKLITDGTVDIVVVLESPFSHFALTRALANGVEHHHWHEKQTPENLINLLQYPNVTIRVTEMAVNCSLFFTSQAVYYDPYLWALPHGGGRTENKFWVLEFVKISDKELDCYSLLEKHFDFLFKYSVPLEEVLHTPEKGSQVPRGVDFFRFFKENPDLALNRYNMLTEEFKQNVRRLKERQL